MSWSENVITNVFGGEGHAYHEGHNEDNDASMMMGDDEESQFLSQGDEDHEEDDHEEDDEEEDQTPEPFIVTDEMIRFIRPDTGSGATPAPLAAPPSAELLARFFSMEPADNLATGGIPVPHVWAARIADDAFQPHVATNQQRIDAIAQGVSNALFNMWNGFVSCSTNSDGSHDSADAVLSRTSVEARITAQVGFWTLGITTGRECHHMCHIQLLKQLKKRLTAFWKDGLGSVAF